MRRYLPNLVIFLIFITLGQRILAQSSLIPRKTDWTVAEIKQWAKKNKEHGTWHGWLLYQGSDSTSHYFISRVMDEWIWFKVKRTDILLVEERAHEKGGSATLLGYYYVDATKEFIKIKDY